LEARPARVIPTATTPSTGAVAQITDIRHWSFPGLTRVVVDLQAEVSPHGDRLRNPERIYFDLPNTRLGAALRAKTLQIGDSLVQRIRIAQTQTDVTRVVADLSGEGVEYTLSTLANPPRIVLELRRKDGASPPAPEPPGQANSLAAKPTLPSAAPQPVIKVAAPPSPTRAVVVKATLPPVPDIKASVSKEASPGPVLSSAIPKTEISTPPVQTAPAPPPEPRMTAKAAEVNSRGQRNLIRALGLKVERVVIDAGHGGHDTGTIGPTGLMEKDLTLNLAQRLGALISERLGSEVIYTRSDDTFVALEDRTGLANEKQADLFISVHANSSRLRAVSGIETYYLNLSSDPEALEVAARENAASQKSVHDLQDLVKKITLTEKIAESREFALHVQRSLHRNMSKENAALRNRGVRKAPFVVLIGAQMPAVLAEVSFLSNTRDEKLLKSDSYRQKLAEALFAGVANYAGSLSRVEVAANGDE
jgi:N-acetylmuramoyl-L-alanine amidase